MDKDASGTPRGAADRTGGPGAPPGADDRDPMTTGIHGLLGIEAVEFDPDRVVLRVPVDARLHQPMGLLHGGVSALLAESAASMGALLSVPPGHQVAGVELNASHLRILREGTLTAIATPIRKGRTLQVWEIDLRDQEGRGICRARCTVSVMAPPTEPAG